jgi:hypothetical protein
MRGPVNIESCVYECVIMEYNQSFKATVCLMCIDTQYITYTVYTSGSKTLTDHGTLNSFFYKMRARYRAASRRLRNTGIYIKQSLKREIGVVKTTENCCEVIILYQLIFLRGEHNAIRQELFTQNLNIKLMIMCDFKVLMNHSKNVTSQSYYEVQGQCLPHVILFMKLFRYYRRNLKVLIPFPESF